jgi:hypothetical protein
MDEQGEPVEGEDDDENTVHYFTLWEPEAINGQTWLKAEQIPVPEQWVKKHHPPVGGDFAHLLHPVALEMERATNPAAKYEDAWGWVPPPLVGEGEKVRSDWLHRFLLDPYPIRPAAVLRMPKFNMSSEEASALVNYFAAVDNVRYPFDYDHRASGTYLAQQSNVHPGRLEDALAIITNNNYCVKCHIVSDFVPKGGAKALAPNLAQVHERLRQEYLIPWLANPKRILPYTGMPVNFPLDKPADPAMFETEHPEQLDTSPEQLEAVVDLLLNYDAFANQQVSVRERVKEPPPAEAAEESNANNPEVDNPADEERPADEAKEEEAEPETGDAGAAADEG